MLADATQGGITLDVALNMTPIVRKAAIEVLKDIREKQEQKRGE